MIYLVTGKIGGGKSLFTLTRILEHLGRGGCVFSNFTFNEREVDLYLKRNFGRRLVEGQLVFHDFEEEPEFQKVVHFGIPGCPVMLVCDEAHLYFNASQATQLAARMLKLASFLSQSRKACVDCWFITQHDTTLWAQLRHQALFGYKCRDMRAISLPFVGALPMLGLAWVKYDILSGEIMERGNTPLSKSLFKLYDTRQMYDSQMRELQKTAKVWEPPGKATKGKFENETHVDCGVVRRRAFVRWLQSVGLFPRSEAGVCESGNRGEATERA